MTMKQNLPLYEFGQFTLDPADGLLMRANNLVRLTPKAIDVLCVLVQNSGRVVEKEELMRRCWPDAIVEEANLPQTICILRKALGKSGRKSQYIHTVSRRGYRFKAAVVVRDRASTNAATNGNREPQTKESGDASRMRNAPDPSDHQSIEQLGRIMSQSNNTAKSRTTAGLVSSSLSAAPEVKLTRREKEILQVLVSGKRTSDIAVLLFVSPATVNNQVQVVGGRGRATSSGDFSYKFMVSRKPMLVETCVSDGDEVLAVFESILLAVPCSETIGRLLKRRAG
jgi:DNA-binding winged helix-turn-helix (wHTH) protein